MSPARTDDLDCRSSFINGDLTAENAEEDDLDCRSSFINGTINLWTPQTRGCSFLAEKAACAAHRRALVPISDSHYGRFNRRRVPSPGFPIWPTLRTAAPHRFRRHY